MNASAPGHARRVEVILERIDDFPTLSAVALRVLEITSSDETSVREVIDLVGSDPALSSKVIRLCRRADKAMRVKMLSIDRIVGLIGFEALRSAVLSVEVFETLEGMTSRGGEAFRAGGRFSPEMFWHHCLAVGSAAERLAPEAETAERIEPGEAFLGGLLHDLGHLALYLALPKTFSRVCDFAERRDLPIDQACRQTIGLDTHTAAKRLAERWRLPSELVDLLWLNGTPREAMPEVPNRDLIALVTLADAVARRQMLAHAGHGPRGERLRDLAAPLGISADAVAVVARRLHEDVGARAAGLGLTPTTGDRLLRRSVERAQELLAYQRQLTDIARKAAPVGEPGAAGEEGATDDPPAAPVKTDPDAEANADADADAVHAVVAFYEDAADDRSLVESLGSIVRAAHRLLGAEAYALLVPGEEGADELYLFPPTGAKPEHRSAPSGSGDASAESRVGWPDAARVELGREGAVLLARGARPGAAENPALTLLARAWGGAAAAAIESDRNRRLNEQLAEVNRELVEMRDELARTSAMRAVGEMAAGAAHEMNNPLAVISGRAQLLRARAKDAEQREMAEEIVRQAGRLSDLVSALRLSAETPEARPRSVDLGGLLDSLASTLKDRVPNAPAVRVEAPAGADPIVTDPENLGAALLELLRNAAEARPRSAIVLRAEIAPADDRWTVQVVDDGVGLSTRAAAHAFDPFFSEKPAGRQPGLGLTRAKRLIESVGGSVSLKPRGREAGCGTVASVTLPRAIGVRSAVAANRAA